VVRHPRSVVQVGWIAVLQRRILIFSPALNRRPVFEHFCGWFSHDVGEFLRQQVLLVVFPLVQRSSVDARGRVVIHVRQLQNRSRRQRRLALVRQVHRRRYDVYGLKVDVRLLLDESQEFGDVMGWFLRNRNGLWA
jgi:hypothetical protein